MSASVLAELEFLDKAGKMVDIVSSTVATLYIDMGSKAPVLIFPFNDSSKACEVSSEQLKYFTASAIELSEYLTKNQRRLLISCKETRSKGEPTVYTLERVFALKIPTF